ncbi:MAG: zinc-ribbon domain-containing protein [Clostridia bacterium]|nr:zinc-ribbon domain-containing protein [Clostridia bacterium]
MKRGTPLAIARPDLLKEWDYEKNSASGLFPDKIPRAYNYKCAWVCSACGHKWDAAPNHRTTGKQPTGCPECAKRKRGAKRTKLASEKNNFAQNYPELAKDWHPSKNALLKPEDVSSFSNKKVWWQCSYCHKEWLATVNHRTGRGDGCPHCSKTGTSFAEQAVYYYVLLAFPDAKSREQIDSLEFDVYIPSEKVAIEYDGYYYHKNKQSRETAKNSLCKKRGITLYRLREKGLPKLTDCICIPCDSRNLSPAIQVLFEYLSKNSLLTIDVDTDRAKITEKFRSVFSENSITKKAPHLLSEWHSTKNGDLSPDSLPLGSDVKVFWKCNTCGYEWKASVSHRANGRNCPACSRHICVTGINDLQTLDPEIAASWNYEKNSPILPSQVAVQSNKKYWWKCENGHMWHATVAGRRINGKLVGCPYCSNYLVLPGYNDLKTRMPKIAAEWHPTKNGKKTPENIVFGTNQKYWWKCSACGGEWEASVASRISGCGCRFCKGKYVLSGFNDLETTHPELSKQWHPTKNDALTPKEVRYGSNKKVWWKCSHCGWEWEAIIKVRARGSLCPQCRKTP